MFRTISPLVLCVLVLGVCGLASCGDDDVPGAGRTDGGTRRDAGAPMGNPGSPGNDAGAVVMLDEDAGAPPLASCPAGDCDLLDPQACGDDQGCVLPHGDGDAAVGPQCAMVGDRQDGESCERSSDCGFGLDCTAFDGTGVCRTYCCDLSRTETCPIGQFCRIGLGAKAQPTGAALCDVCDGCDPTALNACAKGLACYPLPGTAKCTACLPSGASKPGARCKLSTDCASGSACFQLADKSSRCIEFCNFEKAGGCTSGTICRSAGTGLPPKLGLCL